MNLSITFTEIDRKSEQMIVRHSVDDLTRVLERLKQSRLSSGSRQILDQAIKDVLFWLNEVLKEVQ